METLHKLAGVQDASDLQTSSNERPSERHILPDPAAPPVPEKDDFYLQNTNSSQRASRASLPLNRQPSHKSFRSSKHQLSRRSSAVGAPEDYPPAPSLHVPAQAQVGGEASAGGEGRVPVPAPVGGVVGGRTSHDTSRSGQTEGTEDFAWGPNHPCFPHLNPHCAPDSAEYRSTRVIRVKRDWLAAGDLYPQYANLYPEILDPLVSDSEFRYLISNLNARLKAAFDPFSTRAWVDSVMGALTGFVWEDAGWTGAKKSEKGIEAFLEHWNRGREKEGKEVRVVQLRRTGFMGLDFVVPDPGIDGVGEGEEEEEGDGGVGLGPAE